MLGGSAGEAPPEKYRTFKPAAILVLAIMALPMKSLPLLMLFPTLVSCLFLVACDRQFTVSVNNRPVYDPTGRMEGVRVVDADLQGCINLAAQRQGIAPGQLEVLSCAGSGVADLTGIDQLAALRFLDLSNNNVTSVAPLTALPRLSVLNLQNNPLNEVSVLTTVPSLTALNLSDISGLRCSHLEDLEEKLGDALVAPAVCR